MMISGFIFSVCSRSGELRLPYGARELGASQPFRPKTSGKNKTINAVLHSVHRPLIVLES
jgi:hypothetical protein